jgi:ACR3 family arsenite efflux pump ArsB
VAVLVQFLPAEPLLIIAVLFVVLTPCVDYVVTFSHLGRSDAKSLLAATPLLLLA